PASLFGEWKWILTSTFFHWVMLAASYWSLLEPAIELAEDSGKFGALAFLPVAVGFTLGAAFVYFTDLLIPWLGINVSPQTSLALNYDSRVIKEKYEQQATDHQEHENELSIRIGRTALYSDKGENGEPYQRRKGAGHSQPDLPAVSHALKDSVPAPASSSWRRIVLLIFAITIHNIPEGLAVGVGFGAVGKSPSATFESILCLLIDIFLCLLYRYGQLSGMVEPLAGIFGAFAIVLAEPLLPYALAFAAGAMVYVVMDDIIPEAQICGNGKLASWTAILGFVVMMSLDVGLG
uniref:Solute carrier family 39 member 11 n=1 Tax=Naja naja TaxID=35670 RepID=A0A8C6VD42_NAJNA